MKYCAALLSSISLCVFASTPKLSGTYMSSCNWDSSRHANRGVLKFKDNHFKMQTVFYRDSLCLHKSEKTAPAFSGRFAVGKAIGDGILYQPYELAFYFDTSMYGLEDARADRCFYIEPKGGDYGYEDKEKLNIVARLEDNTKDEPCDFLGEMAIYVKE